MKNAKSAKSTSVIEVLRVSKQFRHGKKRFYALRDVSLSVRRGEIFGLLGPNGAGKTTLLNILLGVLLPDKGSARILGRPVESGVLEQTNFVSSEARFHWVLTIKDVLEFYGRVYGLDEKQRKRRIKQLVHFFGLSNVYKSKYSWLSTGERMRLSFAKALLNRPKVLFLDEPTLGLDPDIAIRVRKEVERVNKKFGTTILMTSHYMHEVEQLCDRIAFIHRGRIVDVGSVSKVKLKHFATYDLIVKASTIAVADRRYLRSRGFRIRGTTLTKQLGAEENVSEALALLAKRGITVLNVETKKPTLEDYFVRMTADKEKEAVGEEE